jgi:DNA-binding MarR family transcriptional regulator
MTKAVNRLFQLRKSLDEYEKELGLGNYSEAEKAVFSYISSNSNATITSIKNEPYFSKYSLSTIKRAVLFLTSNNLINANKSNLDKREMILSLRRN